MDARTLRSRPCPGLPAARGGKLDGLRIDHPDGLYDPAAYFRRLQDHYTLACARRAFEADAASHGLDWKDVEGPLRDRIACGGGRGRIEARSARPSTSSPTVGGVGVSGADGAEGHGGRVAGSVGGGDVEFVAAGGGAVVDALPSKTKPPAEMGRRWRRGWACRSRRSRGRRGWTRRWCL